MFTNGAISTSNGHGDNRVLVRVTSDLYSATTQTCHLETKSFIIAFNPSLEFSVFDLRKFIKKIIIRNSDIMENHETVIDSI